MKIGILYDSFQSLENWELRIIDFIIKDSSLEITSMLSQRATFRNTYLEMNANLVTVNLIKLKFQSEVTSQSSNLKQRKSKI